MRKIVLLFIVILILLPATQLLATPLEIDLLLKSGWTRNNAVELISWLDSRVTVTTAVFDHDGTLMHGDLCEGDGNKQLGIFPDRIFRNELLRKEAMATIPFSYKNNPWEYYQELLKHDHAEAYSWLTGLLAGFSVQEARAISAWHYRQVNCHYIFPGMHVLLEILEKRGVEVWVVSASPDVLVKAASAWSRIPVGRIIGIRQRTKKGILTADIIRPVTYAAGKTAIIQKEIRPLSRDHLMVFGNSWGTDGHMLRYASRGGGFALMVNAPKKQRKTIRKYGVKLQSFPAPR